MTRADLRWLVVLAAMTGLFLTAGDAPRVHADAQSRAALQAALSGVESMPDAAYFRAGGTRMLSDLRALYAAYDTPRHVRLRAIRAMGNYDSPAGRAALEEVLRTAGGDELILREALLSLTRAFGQSALPELTRALSDRSPIVRRTAVVALGGLDAAPAREALRAHLNREQDRVVRDLCAEALRGRPARPRAR